MARAEPAGAQIWTAGGAGGMGVVRALSYVVTSLMAGGVGLVAGAVACSRNFAVEKGDFRFSTDDEHHAAALLERHYAPRVRHLEERAEAALSAFEGDAATGEEKARLLRLVASHYLSPTSHDRLFGRDVVVFGGAGEPAIVRREAFDGIRDKWVRVLHLAKVRDCVDGHRAGPDFAAYHEPALDAATARCIDGRLA